MRHNGVMFLAAPQPTPVDLQFSLFGIPVRVSGWFWVGAALLGWGICLSFARGDQRQLLQYLVIWMAAVLLSLLVHEMGHALAYRWFGQSAHVVLYHLGGLAIPDAWSRGAHRPWQRLIISAAGPLAQLALAAAIVAVLKVGGYAVPFPVPSVGAALGLYEGADIGSRFLFALVYFLLQVNIFWPLLNLVPVPPLDGGRIAVSLLPHHLAWKFAKIERFGFPILIVLLLTGVLGMILSPLIRFSVAGFGTLFGFQSGDFFRIIAALS